MTNFSNHIFNGKSIYEYSFSEKIDSFLILWWIDINILKENDFNILMSILGKINNKVFIEFISRDLTISDRKEYNIVNFSYEQYRRDCLWKWDYNVFFDNINFWLSCSEEFFCLIWGPSNIVKKIKDLLWGEYFERLAKFIDEWEWDVKNTWAYNLLKRDNYWN